MKESVENLKSRLSKAIKGPKKQKMKFTLAFQVEYEADPEIYTDPDPVKMGEEDTAAAQEHPFIALRGMVNQPGARFRVKCEPILNAGQKAGLEVENKT